MTEISTQDQQKLTPALWIVLALLSISLLINYVDRSSISTAAPLIQAEFSLSATELGHLFAAFSYTYAVFLVLSGWLADRYNVNWILAIGFALWSVSTLLTGFATGIATFFVLRLLLGIGESVAYPCYSRIVVRQFPSQNRGLANSVIAIGMPGGLAVGTFAGAILMGQFGWRPFFIFLGAGTMLWLIPWIIKMPKEKVLEPSTIQKSPDVGKILAQRSFWGTCAGLFALNFVLYFMINWLPLYLVRERGFAMNRVATVGFVYLIAAVLSPLFGWLSDYLIIAGLSPSQSRKSIMAGGLAIAALSLLACVVVEKHEVALMLMMFAGVGFGLSNSQTFTITQTLAGPNASGRWTGFQNFMGNFAGILGPLIAGELIDRTGHFFWAFALTTIVGLIGVMVWVFVVGPLEQVKWD
ncbi:MAG TPA: MFS transporter [Terriglobales bacterium]|nr:MFS transporter [Terriglobales bacterium]